MKWAAILEQNDRYHKTTHEAVVTFLKPIDQKKALAKFARLAKPHFVALIFRENTVEAGEHWHILIRGVVSRSFFRELLVYSLCKDKRRVKEQQQASAIIDLHFEDVNQDFSKELFDYTAKFDPSDVSKLVLFPKGTRSIRRIGAFLAKSGEELWAEWKRKKYPASHLSRLIQRTVREQVRSPDPQVLRSIINEGRASEPEECSSGYKAISSRHATYAWRGSWRKSRGVGVHRPRIRSPCSAFVLNFTRRNTICRGVVVVIP